MEIGDWITLAAVVVALSIGVASIIQTNKLQKRERKERILSEIVDWVSDFKCKVVPTTFSEVNIAQKNKYEYISTSLASAMLKAELMKLRAKENCYEVVEELDNVWRSAFLCAQLANRMLGIRPSEEQLSRWDKPAVDISQKIDKLEKEKKLSDEELYKCQRQLLTDISTCIGVLVKLEANLN